MSNPDEFGAGAVKEIAKAIGKSVEHLDAIERVGTKIAGPLGALWCRLTIRAELQNEYLECLWRAKNWTKTAALAKEFYEKNGIDLDEAVPLPSSIAVQYRNAIEIEDREDIQKLWAQLLFNATKPNASTRPRRFYKTVLENIESRDARLFQFLFEEFSSNLIYFEGIVDDNKDNKLAPYIMTIEHNDGERKIGTIPGLLIDRKDQLTQQYGDLIEINKYGGAQIFVFKDRPRDIFVSMDNLCSNGLFEKTSEIDDNAVWSLNESAISEIMFSKKLFGRSGSMGFEQLPELDLKRIYTTTRLGQEFFLAVNDFEKATAAMAKK